MARLILDVPDLEAPDVTVSLPRLTLSALRQQLEWRGMPPETPDDQMGRYAAGLIREQLRHDRLAVIQSDLLRIKEEDLRSQADEAVESPELDGDGDQRR
jgi:hypothetical protein